MMTACRSACGAGSAQFFEALASVGHVQLRRLLTFVYNVHIRGVLKRAEPWYYVHVIYASKFNCMSPAAKTRLLLLVSCSVDTLLRIGYASA